MYLILLFFIAAILAMKNKEPPLHNAPLEHCHACLGTADRRHAQWKALTRRACRVKNAA